MISGEQEYFNKGGEQVSPKGRGSIRRVMGRAVHSELASLDQHNLGVMHGRGRRFSDAPPSSWPAGLRESDDMPPHTSLGTPRTAQDQPLAPNSLPPLAGRRVRSPTNRPLHKAGRGGTGNASPPPAARRNATVMPSPRADPTRLQRNTPAAARGLARGHRSDQTDKKDHF